MNYLTKKIKIIVGKPVLRNDLSEDPDAAIKELRALSEGLKKA